MCNPESRVPSWMPSVAHDRERWWSSSSTILTNDGHWLSSIPWLHEHRSSSASCTHSTRLSSSSPWQRTATLRCVQDGEDTETESTVRYLSRITNFAVKSFPMVFAAFTIPMAIVIDIVGDYIIIGDSITIGDFIVDGTVGQHLSSLVAFVFERNGGSFINWRFLHLVEASSHNEGSFT